MPKALIFGINGQDGFYLEKLLTENRIEVTGVSRSDGAWLKGDVSDAGYVKNLIQAQKPDYIFHLAANSKTSHDLLAEHQATIVDGTINILETAYQHLPSAKIFITGSGLQFQNTGLPAKETTPFEASDAYSLARIQSVYAARYYRTKGIKAFVGYLFHHDSPFRTADHLNKKIVDAAIAVAAGKETLLSIGDINVEKEFGFAGDIAKGIFHLMGQENFYEACIGTGRSYTIEKWLELCFTTVGKRWQEHVTINEGYKATFSKMVSDSSLLQSTGWKPLVSIQELADMMLKSETAK